MQFTGQKMLAAATLLIILTFSVCAIKEKNQPDDTYKVLFGRHTKIFAPPLPEQVSFCNEKVPLDIFYVRESLDREIMASTFMHSTSIMMFKRAARWFPVIEPILARNGVPDDFKFLAVAESNLLNVVSPAKAEGYWQFLESTGKQYGLEINDYVDERYHMEKATEAACAYFKAAYAKFGSWALVAAAYNRGSDGLERAIQNQKTQNYYELYLNDETSRYVYRIIALKEIYLNPVKYGFYMRKSDLYPPFNTSAVKVDSSIQNLPAFARSYSSNFRIFRELNPWIRNYALPNKSGKTYIFKIPADGQPVAAYPDKESGTETFFNDTLNIIDLR
jgi:hypothetical protein